MATINEVRSLALALPETEEMEHWGKPSFRVRNKVFAVMQLDGVSCVVKTTKDERWLLTTAEPDVYRMPDGFANLAFMVVRMDRIDAEQCRHLLIHAWRLVSPKKVVKAYDESLVNG